MKCLFDGSPAKYQMTTRSLSAPVCALHLVRWTELGLLIEATAIERPPDVSGGGVVPTQPEAGGSGGLSTAAAGEWAETVGDVWGGGTA